jgi:hypothetical protein
MPINVGILLNDGERKSEPVWRCCMAGSIGRQAAKADVEADKAQKAVDEAKGVR